MPNMCFSTWPRVFTCPSLLGQRGNSGSPGWELASDPAGPLVLEWELLMTKMAGCLLWDIAGDQEPEVY